MAGAYTLSELLDFHKKLKAKQDSLEPYLTIRMMMEVLGYRSQNSIQNILPKLIDLGLVEQVEWGKVSHYRILDNQEDQQMEDANTI